MCNANVCAQVATSVLDAHNRAFAFRQLGYGAGFAVAHDVGLLAALGLVDDQLPRLGGFDDLGDDSVAEQAARGRVSTPKNDKTFSHTHTHLCIHSRCNAANLRHVTVLALQGVEVVFLGAFTRCVLRGGKGGGGRR